MRFRWFKLRRVLLVLIFDFLVTHVFCVCYWFVFLPQIHHHIISFNEQYSGKREVIAFFTCFVWSHQSTWNAFDMFASFWKRSSNTTWKYSLRVCQLTSQPIYRVKWSSRNLLTESATNCRYYFSSWRCVSWAPALSRSSSFLRYARPLHVVWSFSKRRANSCTL